METSFVDQETQSSIWSMYPEMRFGISQVGDCTARTHTNATYNGQRRDMLNDETSSSWRQPSGDRRTARIS